jgi:5-methylcytosine-specific restriction endonuclease McrA
VYTCAVTDLPRRPTDLPPTVFLRDGTPLIIETADPEIFGRRKKPPAPSRYRLGCANCDSQFETGRGARPFCSLGCKDTAHAVRSTRVLLARDPAAFRPGLPYECRIKIAHALRGGYPAARRSVPASTRSAVKERDSHRCVFCGDPGTDIDHIEGDDNGSANLRLLCSPCHQTRTEERLRPITDPAMARAYDAILRRAFAPRPERPCDRPEWEAGWRTWCLANRRPAG